MITATYHRSYNRLTVTGHAHSGEEGHDLVCASVSALVLALAGNVGSLITQGNASDHIVVVKSGNAEIACKPRHKMRSVVTLIFDTVCTGFEILQTLYPEYISYQVLG